MNESIFVYIIQYLQVIAIDKITEVEQETNKLRSEFDDHATLCELKINSCMQAIFQSNDDPIKSPMEAPMKLEKQQLKSSSSISDKLNPINWFFGAQRQSSGNNFILIFNIL